MLVYVGLGVLAIAVLAGVIGFIVSRLSAPEKEDMAISKDGNWLVGTGGEVEGKRYHIGARTVVIGRDPGSFVQLRDPRVSRRHVQLIPVEEGIQLLRLGDRCAVYVNDEEVTEVTVSDGAAIRIGEAAFVYYQQAGFDPGENAGLGTKAVDARAKMLTMDDNESKLSDLVQQALQATDGDVAKAAKQLGVSEEVLRQFMAKSGH